MIVSIVVISVLIVVVSVLFLLIVGYGNNSTTSNSNSNGSSTTVRKNFKTSNSKRKLDDDDVALCRLLGLQCDNGHVTDQLVVLSLDEVLLHAIHSCSSKKEIVINTMKRISHICILFIIANTTSDDGQQQILTTISDAIDSECLPAHRVLFYETNIGKIAIVRQINPSIYIDHCNSDLNNLSKHIAQVLDGSSVFTINDIATTTTTATTITTTTNE